MIKPPAVAVIFTSVRTAADDAGYAAMAEHMAALVERQPGYLGMESVRDSTTGRGITVSYWRDEAAAQAWKQVAAHVEAQHLGRHRWYSEYDVVVAEVTRGYASPGSVEPRAEPS